MRVAWLSNTIWSGTGYGNQTRTFVPRLQKAGHQMAVLAFYGLEGGMLNANGIPIYPKGYHPYGQDVMAAHSAHFQADILISLMDAWVVEPRLMGNARWCPWFPIDSEPLPQMIRGKVTSAFQPIVYSRFGERMCQSAGLDVKYVPHGVDCGIFKPLDRAKAHEVSKLPTDRYIVGMVAANKGMPSRKAFCPQIEAFARFHKAHPDTLLYLHTSKEEQGQQGGVNLPEFCRFHGLEIDRDVLFCDQYTALLGYPDFHMAAIYNSFDVLMSVSMGEGFGIPILEAQACGVPVIVGDWTSMGELCFSGQAIPKSGAEPWWTPLATYQFYPHVAPIADALEWAWSNSSKPRVKQVARMRAFDYDADRVVKFYWRPVLKEIADRIGVPVVEPTEPEPSGEMIEAVPA